MVHEHQAHPWMETLLRMQVTQPNQTTLRMHHPHRKTRQKTRVLIWDTGKTLKRPTAMGGKGILRKARRVSKLDTDPCLKFGKNRVSKIAFPVSQNGTLTL